MKYCIGVLVSIIMAGFGAGCGSESKPVAPVGVTIDLDQEKILGQWVWDHSFGGIAGMEITPESTGQTRRLVFEEQHLLQFVNDSLRQSNEYYLALDKTIFSTDSVPVVYLDNVAVYPYYFENVNLLILNDNFVDGFAHYYRRE